MKPLLARLFAILLASGMLAPAHADEVSEVAVKAVLLFKLPRFVYLPDAPPSPRICVLGNDALRQAVEKLSHSSSSPLPLEVQAQAGLAGVERCNFLFLGRSATKEQREILRKAGGAAVVTVSDIEGFALSGGMIEFAPKDDRSGIQILINRRVASQQNIGFNAQLLRLSRVVEP